MAGNVLADQQLQRVGIAAAHGIDERGVDIARIVEDRGIGRSEALVDGAEQEALHLHGGMIAEHHRILHILQRADHLVGRKIVRTVGAHGRGRGERRAEHRSRQKNAPEEAHRISHPRPG